MAPRGNRCPNLAGPDKHSVARPMSIGKLPPIPPPPPRRSLSHRAAKALTEAVDPDAETPPRNDTATLYRALIGVFDSMSQSERTAFVEYAELFRALSPTDQRIAVAALRMLSGKRGR